MTTADRKTEILSEIDKVTKQYDEFVRQMDKQGLDFTGAKALSDLAYTLEDCRKFITNGC